MRLRAGTSGASSFRRPRTVSPPREAPAHGCPARRRRRRHRPAKKLWPTCREARVRPRTRQELPPPGCGPGRPSRPERVVHQDVSACRCAAATRSGMARASAKNRRAGGVWRRQASASAPAPRLARGAASASRSCASRQTAACARHASPHRMSSRAVKNDARAGRARRAARGAGSPVAPRASR